MFLFSSWKRCCLNTAKTEFVAVGFLTCCFVLVPFKGCCSDAEAQQTGRRQTPSQPIQCELPTVPVQIGAHFLKGISFNESAADNLKLKTVMTHSLSLSTTVILFGA